MNLIGRNGTRLASRNLSAAASFAVSPISPSNRFAWLAMLEIRLVESRFINSAHRAQSVAHHGPAKLQHFVLGGGKGAAGKPGCGQANRVAAESAKIFGNEPHFFEFAWNGSHR